MHRLVLAAAGAVLLLACGDGVTQPRPNSWVRKASLPGGTLRAAVSFVIGDKLYVGTGLRDQYTQSFYHYDPVRDRWTQAASHPGEVRADGIGFAIGDYGYAGLGSNCLGLGACTFKYFNDLWRYSPDSDSWVPMADLPSAGGPSFSSFVVGDRAYVAGSSAIKELWEYEPVGNTWIQRAGYPGGCAAGRTAFSAGRFGYLGLGHNSGTACSDFWRYDPFFDTWTEIATFPGPSRRDANGFSGADAPFVAGGATLTSDPEYLADLWAYNSEGDSWVQIPTEFPGEGRADMLAGTVAGRIFLGLGTKNSIGGSQDSFDDFWEYIPDR